MERKIYYDNKNNVCYFRTGIKSGYTKVLIQITDKCNMYCKHCFVNANSKGNDLTYDDFIRYYPDFFKKFNTKKVTLTGGEPFVSTYIYDICKWLDSNNIKVTICTNGYIKDKNILDNILGLKNILFNISLDGFSINTINNFRGHLDAFDIITKNIKYISSKAKLKGILCTPNAYGTINEYIDLVQFAKEYKAKYVLFNPIGAFGRGNISINNCYVDDAFLNELRLKTQDMQQEDFQISYIRFPNLYNYTVNGCNFKGLYYIYVNGDVVGCPYVSFALRSIISSDLSILGNLRKDAIKDIKEVKIINKNANNCLAHEILDKGMVNN